MSYGIPEKGNYELGEELVDGSQEICDTGMLVYDPEKLIYDKSHLSHSRLDYFRLAIEQVFSLDPPSLQDIILRLTELA